MRLKLDENLGRREADLLRAAGHDVATVPEQGMCAAPDGDVIGACSREVRALVTLDLGFANPLLFDPAEHSGIAVLRLPARATAEHLRQAVATLASAVQSRQLERRLWIVEIGRVREYQQQGDDVP
jgi:predicted nuclease of predicted toxin-antitoxin system